MQLRGNSYAKAIVTPLAKEKRATTKKIGRNRRKKSA
jgi:hypothetical protein